MTELAHDFRRGDGDGKWIRETFREVSNGFAATAKMHCDLQGDVKDGTCSTIGVVKDAQGVLRGDVQDARAGITASMRSGFDAAALAACHSDERLSDGLGRVTDTIVGVGAATQNGLCHLGESIAQGAKETALGFKDQIIEANKNVQILSVQAERIGNALSVQGTMYANQLGLQAQTYAAASELRAQQIANAAAQQVAALRCDVLEKISTDGQLTRAKLDASAVEALRDRLHASEMASLEARIVSKICCGCNDGGNANNGKKSS